MGSGAPFEPRIEGGRMYGRGVMDMKASLAACMLAVARAQDMGLRGDVVLTAVADEEHGSVGTEAALRQVRADAAIVTEPSDLALHLAHRGFAVFEVTLSGKASHTSQPEAGVNALTHLGRLGGEIEALLAQAICAERGREPKRLGAPYWTDAALVAAAGIPTILFGPVGGDIHQPSEWLDLASVPVMLRVLERTIGSFCR